jgi:hypothetical protein
LFPLASIQQSAMPTFATADATNHPIEQEEDSLIRDIPSNLICHVSKKGGMKSPRLIPKTVSNQGKGHGTNFKLNVRLIIDMMVHPLRLLAVIVKSVPPNILPQPRVQKKFPKHQTENPVNCAYSIHI